jgi:phosphoglycerate kinase
MIKYLNETKKPDISGTVLLRLDFNSEDDWRLRAAVPTIKFLLKRAAKIIIVSHKGRPHGFDAKLSLKRNASQLQKILSRKIVFVPHFRFGEIKQQIKVAPPKTVFVLENLRFLPGEEKNDAGLAKKLASLADFYVNDAFAVCHRANASVAAITKFLPSYAGLELQKEIKFLSGVMKKPKHPLVFVLGGAKAADKLGVIEYFMNKADHFLLGGAAANTTLFLRGVDIGKSLIDRDPVDLKKLRKTLNYRNMILPIDFKYHHKAAWDIGPKTIKNFVAKVKDARTIIWSGPVGFFEKRGFAAGNLAVARAIANNRQAFSVVGGGETVAFLKQRKLDKKFSFISTGGGAMLDFLAGKKLPGIEALKK